MINIELTSSLDIDDPVALGNFVRAYRKKNKLSQEDISTFGGVSRVVVSDLENARRDIKISNILKVLKACSLILSVRTR